MSSSVANQKQEENFTEECLKGLRNQNEEHLGESQWRIRMGNQTTLKHEFSRTLFQNFLKLLWGLGVHSR